MSGLNNQYTIALQTPNFAKCTHHLEHAAPADVAVVRPRRAGDLALFAEAVRPRVHPARVHIAAAAAPACAQRVHDSALLVLVHPVGALVLVEPAGRGQHAGSVVEEDVEEQEDGPAAVQEAEHGRVPVFGRAEQGEEEAEVQEGDGADERHRHHHEAGAEAAHEQVEERGEADLWSFGLLIWWVGMWVYGGEDGREAGLGITFMCMYVCTRTWIQ